MTMGALLDAGADLNFVVATLKQLDIDGWALSAERVERKGIDATGRLWMHPNNIIIATGQTSAKSLMAVHFPIE